MILETPRLILTPLGLGDLPKIWEWKSGRTGRMMHTLIPGERDFEEFRRDAMNGRFGNGLCYAVHLKEDGLALIGAWWACQAGTAYPEAICSLIFGQGHHGKCYAEESGRALIAHAIELGYKRLAVYIDAQNRPAARLAKRLGFKQEGLFEYPGRAFMEVWARLTGKDGL